MIDPAVRPVRMDKLDTYLVAAIDMFTGEVGVNPPRHGRRWPRLPSPHRRPDRCGTGMGPRSSGGKVVFKAEVGSQSPSVGQIQGCRVHPEWRGHGMGTTGTAALAAAGW